jgi:hypothetical protein
MAAKNIDIEMVKAAPALHSRHLAGARGRAKTRVNMPLLREEEVAFS